MEVGRKHRRLSVARPLVVAIPLNISGAGIEIRLWERMDI
jgi:hypothetical protein